MQLTDYHAKYYAYELTKRCPSDSLEKLTASLSDAQIDPNPHQIEAALFAFRSPLSKGAILADEVGLGKTIEAGLILSQKWAERKRKILIIVPSNLRKQWNQELLDKFFLSSNILETQSFNKELKNANLNPFNQKEIVICSYQFARSKDVYIRQIDWDLVIIDEAHRLRNVYKPSNKIGNALKIALAKVPKLLLTATPLQNSLLELYGLVSFIDDYTFGDLKSFKSQFARLTNESDFADLKERLKPICKRTLRRQVLEYIKYTNRIPITQEFIPSENEQRLYDLVSEYLQRPNLYALPSSQRQLMTLILRKLLASSTYAISGTLEALTYRLEGLVAKQESAATLETAFTNDYESYEDLKEEWVGEEEEPKAEKQYSLEEVQDIRAEIETLKEFYALAKGIMVNSKGQVLLTALKKGFAMTAEKGGHRKALIFTESTRTQEYLRKILEDTESKGKIVVFNGSNNDPKSREIYQHWLKKYQDKDHITGSKTADMRSALVDYFKNEAEIMIATEAAAEGINLQFCSLVVNYDLPWNPQRIEQRIGRCHRYGQSHDVVVVNFLNKRNAADQRVYQLLDQKFKLFNGVFGASDEVLGSIESGVDFEKRIAQIYQCCRTEAEIQQAFDELQQEMESQIDEKISLTRQNLLENFDEEVTEKLRINLQESKEYLSKYENQLWDLTKHCLNAYADFAQDQYSFTLRKNPFSEAKIYPGPYRIGKNVEDANVYRIGHPLAQRIIENCKSKALPEQELVFNFIDTGRKITVLEPLIGKSGWLSLYNLTVSSFETEDHLLYCGASEDGINLDIEQCQRLFSLPATVNSDISSISEQSRNILTQIAHNQQVDIIQVNSERNAGFFDTELAKLDKWAEDIKNSIEIELKELDKEIRFRKTESKKILSLEVKVKTQRQIKELEKKRNILRQELYQSQDEVDVRKEQLIAEIEARLKQQVERDELFTVKWRVV
ncbi:MAG TPA: DEAD/DEAH box helicase [Firmicutes bacterium]|jgi:ERCC4-related helicase|nr:DEAD/DEAH box helicase [Bacillota bacterium]